MSGTGPIRILPLEDGAPAAAPRRADVRVKPVRLLVRGDRLLAFDLERIAALELGRQVVRLHADGDFALHRVLRVTRAEDAVIVELLCADGKHRYPARYDSHGFAAVVDRRGA